MQPERQRRILRQLFEFADGDGTLLAAEPLRQPVAAYVDRTYFQTEIDRLFRSQPSVVCLSADVRSTGDCYATEIAGLPVLTMRQPDGSLRAFANICRHRGSPLAPPGHSSVQRSLRCGFHGWTYGLDGMLTARPHSAGGFESLGDECSSLIPLAVAEAHGLVFVQADRRPLDIEPFLDGVQEELDEFRFERYARFGEWIDDWSANWKLLVETFLETYHVPALHPTTVARHFVVQPSLYQPFGPHARFHSLMKSCLAQRSLPEAQWSLIDHGTVEYFISPNTVLNYSVDHVAVYRFLPLSVDRTRSVFTLYTPTAVSTEEARSHFERTIALHKRVSGGEDFVKQEQVQKAIASGALDHVVFGRNEAAAIHFHRSLYERTGGVSNA